MRPKGSARINNRIHKQRSHSPTTMKGLKSKEDFSGALDIDSPSRVMSYAGFRMKVEPLEEVKEDLNDEELVEQYMDEIEKSERNLMGNSMEGSYTQLIMNKDLS